MLFFSEPRAMVIGFALHNATEGCGITAPLSGDEERPSWRSSLASERRASGA